MDRHGRQRQVVPTAGRARVVLRAAKFHVSTSANWVRDVFSMWLDTPPALRPSDGVLLSVDGGPDLTPSSVVNMLMFGRLWLALGLPMLAVVTHAAGWSALNWIEHLWAPLSNALTGVRFSPCIDGETSPPAMQSSLTHAERSDKEAKVFDRALQQMKHIFERVVWAGHRVAAFVIPCQDKAATVDAPANAVHDSPTPPRTDDYGTVHDALQTATADRISHSPALRAIRDELVFFLRHVDRRRYGFAFKACTDAMCKCGGATERQSDFLTELAGIGGQLPSPTPSAALQDKHYLTLLEHLAAGDRNVARGDLHLPSRIASKLSWCPLCPSYAVTSPTDDMRHYRLVHGKKAASIQPDRQQPSFPCRVRHCKEVFDTVYDRDTHERCKAHDYVGTKKGQRAGRAGDGRFTAERTRPTGPAAAVAIAPNADRKRAPAAPVANRKPKKRIRQGRLPKRGRRRGERARDSRKRKREDTDSVEDDEDAGDDDDDNDESEEEEDLVVNTESDEEDSGTEDRIFLQQGPHVDGYELDDDATTTVAEMRDNKQSLAVCLAGQGGWTVATVTDATETTGRSVPRRRGGRKPNAVGKGFNVELKYPGRGQYGDVLLLTDRLWKKGSRQDPYDGGKLWCPVRKS